MVYANIPTELLERMEIDGVSRDARLLLIEMYAHCAHVLTDGAVTVRLSRISDHRKPEALADELAQAGYIEPMNRGFRIVEYLNHNADKEAIERHRANARKRKDRYVRHRSGDHSLCLRSTFCPEGAIVPDICLLPPVSP